MMLKQRNRVRETTSTSGSGPYLLAGAVAGFDNFAKVYSANDKVAYCVTDNVQWEAGQGTFTGTTVTRDLVEASSTGSPIVWSANTKQIYVTTTQNSPGPADTLTPIVKNGEGSTLTVGTLVSIDSFPDILPSVKKTDITALDEAFAVIVEDIPTGAFGNPARSALVQGFNTSSQQVGDPVWMSKTAGGFEYSPPKDAIVQIVGWVAHVGSGSTGAIYFEPQPREKGRTVVTLGSNTTVATGTLFTPTWDTVLEDTLGIIPQQIWPNTILVVPTRPSIRAITGHVSCEFNDDAPGGNIRYCDIQVVGSTYGQGRFQTVPPAITTPTYIQATTSVQAVAPNTQLRSSFFQDSGANRTLPGNSTRVWFEMVER